jgi:hypothetical protein
MGYWTNAYGLLQRTLVQHRKTMALFSGGIAAGIIVAVAAGWSKIESDVFKVVGPILGTLLGTSLAIVGSRALSDVTDRRDRLRRMQSAVLRMEELDHVLTQYLLELSEFGKSLVDADDPKTVMTKEVLAHFSGRAMLLDSIASKPPIFDGLLETSSDRHHAHQVNIAFRAMSELEGRFVQNEMEPTERTEALVLGMASPFALKTRRGVLETLQTALSYFHSRLNTM